MTPKKTREKKTKPRPPVAEATAPRARPAPDFPIVGIGASAGGLAAFEAFFSALPADVESGMAFVLVQHLAPDHKSILVELVKRYTRMQVYEVQDGMQVKPNCAYIIPPNRDMAFLNGALQLLEPAAPRGRRLPIDFFFRSLAQDRRERAICIVLSGTGSDGTLGIRAVKGEGGMIMAQEPDSTEHDGMPRSAIATGLVDFVLRPAEMPAQLIGYASHAFGRRSASAPAEASAPAPGADDTLLKICVLLRAQTGHDFSQYKGSTLVRRMERRMALHQIERPEEYLRFLRKDPPEIEALFRDLLIGVTSFFRDAEAFATLDEQILPRLLSDKGADGELRIWVTGCSTGEEAYSIAILIQERLETLKQRLKVQVFATDIDRQAIEQARGGDFPASIAADVSPERLARFFVHDAQSDRYRVHKHIRELIIFSEQNVIKDPPFSRLDLLCCRNLLIYMNAELQQRLIPLFHYALRPDGVLFLGSSETVGGFATLFTALDRTWKIYRRQTDLPGAIRPPLGNFKSPLTETRAPAGLPRGEQPATGQSRGGLGDLIVRAMLQHYAQVGVLINGRGDILHIHGRTGKYLEPAPGDAGMNILSMARPGLRRELTTALHRAATTGELVRYPGLRVRNNGDSVTVDLVVKPVAQGEGGAPLPDVFLVLVEEVARVGADAADDSSGDPVTPAPENVGRLSALERDLRAKEEYLQTTLEELETTNEELRSSNEEMQSVNEELQSTNEELETSKEELQSVNEELATVNAELQTRVSDLSRANNDMSNLLAGTGVGTLFVDHELRITRFTPAATQVINFIQGDVGRPVGHIVSNLVGYSRLVEDVQAVLDTLIPVEAEVQTKAGAWYLMRVRPYRTLENVIEGAVITFVDITGQKLAELALRAAQDLAQSILATVRDPLLVLDKDLRVVSANAAFYRLFGSSRVETKGRLVYELDNGQWDIPDLRRLLEEIIPQHRSFDDYTMTHEFDKLGRRELLLNARRVRREDGRDEGRDELVLLAIEDITGRGSKNREGNNVQ